MIEEGQTCTAYCPVPSLGNMVLRPLPLGKVAKLPEEHSTLLFGSLVQCFPSILHRANGKYTGSGNRLHVSGPIDAGVTRWRSRDAGARRSGVMTLYPNIKQYARLPNTWDGNGCRGTTAPAQHARVRADCFLSPAHTSLCRSEAALDEEVKMAKLVSRRGSIWGGEEAARTVID
ncbi:hypothetical protein N431DRAFT_223879 [Stipitochalara longipes BDJ]|nr:hypothetical protein N431DRAFT_223879 [Stipitochalara longipes BDJ]